MSYNIKTVLISDDIDQVCVDLLRESGVSVTLKTKWEKGELIKEIEKYEALIVRSATKVTADVINAGKNLKLIGRAGTGVDNIDVKAATASGIIVMNTPAGNSKSAAELTCAFISCLARSVPQACASLKQGVWDRKSYMGQELGGKTLAVVGLGRIGREVADKMRAYGMKTIGYDPLVSAEDSAKFNIEWLPLEKIWPIADYITVHVPLIPQTENLINLAVFSKCKKGVMIINCARGGIVSENDLLVALNDGRCGGAALDVFVEEPPPAARKPLLEHPKLICTPHLGASTKEAQVRVAREIAEQIVALNRGVALLGAINADSIAHCLDKSSAQWVKATQDLAHVAKALLSLSGKCDNAAITVSTFGELSKLGSSLKAAALVGFLKDSASNSLNMVNVMSVSQSKGIQVTTEFTNSADNAEFLTVTLSASGISVSVSGLPSSAATILVQIDKQQTVGIVLKGHLIFYKSSAKKLYEICGLIDASVSATYCSKDGQLQVASFDSSVSELPGVPKDQYVSIIF